MRGAQYPTIVRWKDISENSEEKLVLTSARSPPVTEANITLVRGPSALTIGASPLPQISMVMANFACLYAPFQRAKWMIKASEALRPILCSGPTAKAYFMFAMTQEQFVLLRFGNTASAAQRELMSLFMKRKIRRSASGSISRSRGSSCCLVLRENTLVARFN